MKNHIFRGVLGIIVAINTSSVLAVIPDYRHLSYATFVDLESGATKEKILAAFDNLISKYDPKNATNFLDERRYELYNIQETKNEYSRGTILNEAAIYQKMIIDLIEITQKNAQNNVAEKRSVTNDYRDYYTRINQYIDYSLPETDRKKITNEFYQLYLISTRLSDIVSQQKTFSNLMDNTSLLIEQIKTKFESEKVLYSSAKNPLDKIPAAKYAIFNAFVGSYIDKDLRDTMVQTIVDLVEKLSASYYNDQANKLANEMLEIINKEWGNGFPIDRSKHSALAQLAGKTLPEIQPQPIQLPVQPQPQPQPTVLNGLLGQLQELQNQLTQLSDSLVGQQAQQQPPAQQQQVQQQQQQQEQQPLIEFED